MIRFIAPVLALGLAFTACNDDDDDTTETGKAITATPEELDGRWLTGCLPSDVLEVTHTQREYIFNRIGDFDKVERFYNDDSCTEPVAEYKVIGTVKTEGKATEANDAEAEQINFSINEASFKVLSENALTLMNGLSLCGKSDWKLNEEVTVLDANCLGSTVRKGDVYFELYDVKEGQLYFGQNFVFLTKTSADARPSSLNLEVPFAKQ